MVPESALDIGQCHDVSVHTYTRTYLHTRFTVWARTRTKYVYGPQICEFPAFGSPASGRQLLTNNPPDETYNRPTLQPNLPHRS